VLAHHNVRRIGIDVVEPAPVSGVIDDAKGSKPTATATPTAAKSAVPAGPAPASGSGKAVTPAPAAPTNGKRPNA
jgi:hypothetical protein